MSFARKYTLSVCVSDVVVSVTLPQKLCIFIKSIFSTFTGSKYPKYIPFDLKRGKTLVCMQSCTVMASYCTQTEPGAICTLKPDAVSAALGFPSTATMDELIKEVKICAEESKSPSIQRPSARSAALRCLVRLPAVNESQLILWPVHQLSFFLYFLGVL